MMKKHVWILRAGSLWTFYVWGVLVQNMIFDRSNTIVFRAVHIGLAVVSFALAAITWKISNSMAKEIQLRKRSRDLSEITVSSQSR